MKKRITTLVLLCASLLTLAGCGGGETSSPTSSSQSADSGTVDQDVSSLEMKTLPTKTEYFVGETFEPDGGVVTATYADSSTEDISITDSRITLSEPNMSSEGRKNVIVTYGSARTTFQIQVNIQTYTVTFDYNYEGSVADYVTVNSGEAVAQPADPERDGYSFDGWYTDSATTAAYDFSSAVTADLTLYAKWLDASATVYTFTFDLNYYGPSDITQNIEEGGVATRIDDPSRTGYDFTGWYTDENASSAYDFATAVTANTTVYAGWSRNSDYTGTNTFTFEAEDVDLSGKVGNGLSGTAPETAMILKDNYGAGASNERFVGYLYKTGLSLSFYFASDIAVDNVTLAVSFACEVQGYTFNPSNYTIAFNGSSLTYDDIAYADEDLTIAAGQTTMTPFASYTISTSLSVRKGMNLVSLTTSNSDAVDGTTMTAFAPLVDCVNLTVDDAILEWDQTKGLPASNY